jgi:predicted histidine transporter YuiF (NhaC family)
MFFAKWKIRILAGLAIIAGLLTAIARIKGKGRKEERVKNELRNTKVENETLKRNLDAIEKKADIARAVDAYPPGDATRRLRNEWSRDGKSDDDIR